ncbi:MAG: HK97 gp10 family phage protein [Ruminococcus sp.]|nr:HK97 gp10 family phage protein [Ruminococcus sp.]
MSDSISIDEFSEVLAETCRKYTNEITEKVENGIQKIGKEAVSEVKSLSPVYKGNNKKLTKGAYKRGWTYQVDQSRGKIQVTVHNKKYQLVHLLELGHVLRDGTGRVYGEIPPKVHVETAETHAKEKVDALLERATNGT